MKRKYDTYDVFTPSQPAMLTFVDRDEVNKQLVDAIRTPGRQLVIFGYSGSGKTTLINNKLNQLYENVIESQCTKGTTIDQLKLEAFDKLDTYYTKERTSSHHTEISSTLKGLYAEIKAASIVKNDSKQERIVPIQLSDQRLAELIGEANACWKIDDFHKVDKEHKQRLAQIMKVFMDCSKDFKTTKVISIGAVGTGQEVVYYDPEMKERVSEVYVPLMSPMELDTIINLGESLLNVSFSRKIRNKIIVYSNGLPSICHQLCLSMCTNNNIYEISKTNFHFDDTDLSDAIDDYINKNSASLKSTFDKSLKTSKSSSYQTKEILQAIIKLKKDEVTKQEIHKELNKSYSYPLAALTKHLNQLISPERDEVLRLNKDANTYSFSNPFQRAFFHLSFRRDFSHEDVTALSIPAEEFVAFLQAKQDLGDYYNDINDLDHGYPEYEEY